MLIVKKHTQNTDTTLTGSGIQHNQHTGTGNIADFKVGGVVKSSIAKTGDFTGNASTSSKLENTRTITISGDVDGSTTFDGSANANISVALDNVGTGGNLCEGYYRCEKEELLLGHH